MTFSNVLFSPEVKGLHPISSKHEMCMSGLSNVIYHKFLHNTAACKPRGKTVYVMLK